MSVDAEAADSEETAELDPSIEEGEAEENLGDAIRGAEGAR